MGEVVVVLGLGERADEVLQMVALATDKAAQVQHHAASVVALPGDGVVGVLQGCKLLLVALALALELLGNLLLKHKSLEGVVALLLGTGKTDRHASGIVFLLVNKCCQAAIFPLVALNLDLEILSLLGELLGEGLELGELFNGIVVSDPSLTRLQC